MRHMKTQMLSTLCLLLLSLVPVYAQNRGFSFQGYARDANGAPYASSPVSLRFTLTNQAGSVTHYQETQNVTSDDNGTYSAVIGAGNIATFNALDFSRLTDVYLVVGVRLGTGMEVEVTREPLLQAPYAKWADNGLRPGIVIPFGGSKSAIPPGFLPCDGREVPISEFPELHSVLGSRWGTAAAGMFRLPDLRGAFLRGQNDGRTGDYADPQATLRISATGGVIGDQVGSYQGHLMNSHNHTASLNTTGEHDHSFSIPTTPDEDNTPLNAITTDDQDFGAKTWATNAGGAHSHTLTIDNTGGNENRPRNASVYYIIKY